MPNYLFSQCEKQRTSINDLSLDDQCELRNLMLDYLSLGFDANEGPNDWHKYPIVKMHRFPTVGSFSDFHNYQEEFATWHRNYVQGMEEYILSQGYPQYIPLPYWSPHNEIPLAFYNYGDQFLNLGCHDDDGNLTYANLPESDDFPQYPSQGPFAPAPSINFTEFDENLNCSDWSSVDDFVGSMEGPHHDFTHGAVGGTLGPAASAPASTLFWLFHAYITDLHSCYLRECAGSDADIYVRDNTSDNGSVPTIQPTELWTSPDIWVRNEPDGFANNSVEELCFKINEEEEIRPVYVYVRTWNRGNVTSINNENDLKVYWAKPSAGLSWPAPWNGQPTSNSCGLPVGGDIGTQALRAVNGQYLDGFDVDMDGDNTEIIEGYTIYEFKWFPPDPSLYVDCFGGDWGKGHFCIHARVDDGDGFNSTGSFYSDLVMNNDLALKNIYIYGEDDENEICDEIDWLAPPGNDCVFFGNYTKEIMENVALEVSFPTQRDQALLEHNEINLQLKDGAMLRWNEGGGNSQGINYIDGNESIRILTKNGKVEGMTLQPMEVHRFCIEIVGDPVRSDGKDFQLDIIQTVDGAEVGGERFIVKKVTPTLASRSSQNNYYSENSRRYKVSPNPTNDKFTIHLNNTVDIHDIFISNSVGQLLIEYKNVKDEKTVNSSHLGKGIFFINIKNHITGEIINQKVIIE